MKDWDLFVSYCSTDRESFVAPLVRALRSAGLRAWFDDEQLDVGDSLSREIGHGLANSRFCIAVISPRFVKSAWPNNEVAYFLGSEREASDRLVLPILYGIEPADFEQELPLLADRFALCSSMGIDAIVRRISSVAGAPAIPEPPPSDSNPTSDQLTRRVTASPDIENRIFDILTSKRSDAQSSLDRAEILIVDDEDQIGYLHLSVWNDGPQIPEGDLDLVFSEGFSTKGEGRGMGLYLMNCIAEKLGAEVCVEQGAGLRFTAKVPVATREMR